MKRWRRGRSCAGTSTRTRSRRSDAGRIESQYRELRLNLAIRHSAPCSGAGSLFQARCPSQGACRTASGGGSARSHGANGGVVTPDDGYTKLGMDRLAFEQPEAVPEAAAPAESCGGIARFQCDGP